jgi:hypothetical protein
VAAGQKSGARTDCRLDQVASREWVEQEVVQRAQVHEVALPWPNDVDMLHRLFQ